MSKAFFFLAILLVSCEIVEAEAHSLSLNDTLSSKELHKESIPEEYRASHFDYPVGKPDAKGYYNAQGFGKNNHLGDDWNALTGGNSDLGDPVYAIANGKVNYARDHNQSWGNVIRILHLLPDSTQVESLYAHCDTILVTEGSLVKIGDQIGTIGDAHGSWTAHLHLEIRNVVNMSVGQGYSAQNEGYIDPSAFIESHR